VSPGYTLAKLRALPPTISVPELGGVFGISEPVARERLHRGEWQAMGIRIHRLGWKYRVITADVLRALGVSPETDATGHDAGAAAPTQHTPPTADEPGGERTATSSP
jgi:hypothetical protein